jgi:hypothetical protein
MGEVGVVERQRLVDPQAAPRHYDAAAQPAAMAPATGIRMTVAITSTVGESTG